MSGSVTERLTAGVDIGGTAMKIGLVNREGEIRSFLSVETPQESGDDVVARIVEALAGLTEKAGFPLTDLEAIGLGAPATVDLDRGMPLDPPNMPCLGGYPLRDRLSDAAGVPVYIDNDANAFAQAEALFGFGRQHRFLVCLTLGTGIGGGAVLNGRVLRGAGNCAAEFGHTVINFQGPQCGCGAFGCLEAYASKAAINKRAREVIERQLAPELARRVSGGESLSPDLVYQAAKAGDTGAESVLRETGRFLGEGIGSLVNALSPDCVVLGGGVAGAKEYLVEEATRVMHERVLSVHRERVHLKVSELGAGAGMLGAAAVALLELDYVELDAGAS